MDNLKEKILQSLKNSKQVGTTLNTLAKAQENLLKNHSNPVFNKQNKNKIIKSYSYLQDIGKSIYRYNTLQEHNYKNDAEAEKVNIENKVLNGGISYNKYLWHSENSENTCEKCKELDGQVFDYYDEVPERPHPNCKCYVEIIENNKNYFPETLYEEEPCDCLIRLLTLQEKCQNACIEVENLIQEAKGVNIILEEFMKYLLNYSNDNIIESVKELYKLIQDTISEIYRTIALIIQTIQIFYKNWNDLRTLSEEIGHYVNYSAEYYHTKANCEAAQLGNIGEKVATILGYVRECGDIIKEVLFKHQTLKQAFQHSIHDLEVNEAGRKLGRENPNSEIIDIIRRPENLPQKYW